MRRGLASVVAGWVIACILCSLVWPASSAVIGEPEIVGSWASLPPDGQASDQKTRTDVVLLSDERADGMVLVRDANELTPPKLVDAHVLRSYAPKKKAFKKGHTVTLSQREYLTLETMKGSVTVPLGGNGNSAEGHDRPRVFTRSDLPDLLDLPAIRERGPDTERVGLRESGNGTQPAATVTAAVAANSILPPQLLNFTYAGYLGIRPSDTLTWTYMVTAFVCLFPRKAYL